MAEFLKSHVERNVHEVPVGGSGGAGEIEEGADTETLEPRQAACSRQGNRRPTNSERLNAVTRACIVPEHHHERGGDGRSRHKSCGEDEQKKLELGPFWSPYGVRGQASS